MGVHLAPVEPYQAARSRIRGNMKQLRLEYRLLVKVDRNFAGKSSRAIARAGVAVRSRPPNCKMDACI
ncbi:MAG: hypothetical protein ABI262_12270 [Microcoleus sp.]